MKANEVRRWATLVAIVAVALLILSYVPAVGPIGKAVGGSTGEPIRVPTAGAVGGAGLDRPDAGASGPHSGTLEAWDYGPGTTLDPSAAYYSVNAEPIENVYQTLITYNGSDDGTSAANYVPELATCVPGSAECLAQFASSLVFNNRTTGLPQYYSFEIDANARFYDPTTNASWGVYPSDVLFTMARTLGFSEYPGYGYYNGWMNAQAVLPAGNSSWDGGLHAPYNNTPSRVLSAFLVNNSTYCPAPVAGSGITTHGCITWNVGPSGTTWPYLLELVGNPLGGSVEPCGPFTYLGGNVPDFAGSGAAQGDGPCTLPGGFTTTDQAGWASYVAGLSPTSWDAFQQLGINYPSPQAGVQWNMIGSGPYYSLNPVGSSVGYTLRANPAYQAPAGCAGQPGCEPLPGRYMPAVDVIWENNDMPGLDAMAVGVADTAWFAQDDTNEVLNLVAQGDYALDTGIPTLQIAFDPFELNFSLPNLAAIDPIGGINVPGTFLSNVGLREFLVNAFPYVVDEGLHPYQVDEPAQCPGCPGSVQYSIHYGGMIPQFMGPYYPTNISWPGGNPGSEANTTPGSVQWWWTELTTPSSPFYDPTFAACSSSSPCKFPFVGVIEAPSIGLSMKNWLASIETLTGNAVQPYEFDLHESSLILPICANPCYMGPGSGSTPIYSYGWSPDYPDPTDYVAPTYYPDQTFTYIDALGEQLGLPEYNGAGCGHTGIQPSMIGYAAAWANLTYWANGGGGVSGIGVANACQGIAYSAMVTWLRLAGPLTDLSQRQLVYNVAEHIANELALYLYWEQSVGAIDYGVWINPSGINYNPMIGGEDDQLWYDWTYASNVFTATFTESGLPAGTLWSATVSGNGEENSTSDSIVFYNVANGTYPYTIGFAAGYGASPASGSIEVHGGFATVSVVFKALGGATAPVTFVEQGLVSGTDWVLTVTNVGSYQGNDSVVDLALPAGSYDYYNSEVPGYSTPGSGTLEVRGSPVLVTIDYTGVIFSTYPVTFTSLNLPTDQAWSVDVNGFTNTTLGAADTFYERNGTFAWQIVPIPGLSAALSNGMLSVNGAQVSIVIGWTVIAPYYQITFVEGGLPTGTLWGVTVDHGFISSSDPSMTGLVVNGSYAWTAAPVPGYDSDPSVGWVNVSGQDPAPVAVSFLPATGPLFTTTFTMEGTYVSGWTLIVANNSYPENSSVATVDLPGGTYTWSVLLPNGYYASPSGGTIRAGTSVSFVVEGPPLCAGDCGVNQSPYPWGAIEYAIVGAVVLTVILVSAAVIIMYARRKPPSAVGWTTGAPGMSAGPGSGMN
jgi:hypothetical protein